MIGPSFAKIMRAFLRHFLFAVPLVWGPETQAAPLRAGAATANIAPPLGIEMNGGTAPVIATHVHDELHE